MRAIALVIAALSIGFAFAPPAGATTLGPDGSAAGTAFTDACPAGQYLAGLTASPFQFIRAIQPSCAPAAGVGLGPATSSGTVHGIGALTATASCGPAAGIIRARMTFSRDDKGAPAFVSEISLTCHPLSSAATVSDSEVCLDAGQGCGQATAMADADEKCPAGEIATGIVGRADQWLDAFGLVCGPAPAGTPAVASATPGTAAPTTPATGSQSLTPRPAPGKKAEPSSGGSEANSGTSTNGSTTAANNPPPTVPSIPPVASATPVTPPTVPPTPPIADTTTTTPPSVPPVPPVASVTTVTPPSTPPSVPPIPPVASITTVTPPSTPPTAPPIPPVASITTVTPPSTPPSVPPTPPVASVTTVTPPAVPPSPPGPTVASVQPPATTVVPTPAPSDTLSCLGGGGMTAVASNNGPTSILFMPATVSSQSMPPQRGECAWTDRGFHAGEPFMLSLPTNIAGAGTVVGDATTGVPFQLHAHDNGKGALLVTSIDGLAPPPVPGALVSPPQPPPLASTPPAATTAGTGPSQATATTTINIRSAPSSTSAAIGVLQAGVPVTVSSCQAGWCQLAQPVGQKTGWVLQQYLHLAGAAAAAGPAGLPPTP